MSSRIGTKACRISKRQMMDVVEKLHNRGLGAETIAKLTGYHPCTVKRRLRDMGLPRMSTGLKVQKILECLPPQLRSEIAELRTAVDDLDREPPMRRPRRTKQDEAACHA